MSAALQVACIAARLVLTVAACAASTPNVLASAPRQSASSCALVSIGTHISEPLERSVAAAQAALIASVALHVTRSSMSACCGACQPAASAADTSAVTENRLSKPAPLRYNSHAKICDAPSQAATSTHAQFGARTRARAVLRHSYSHTTCLSYSRPLSGSPPRPRSYPQSAWTALRCSQARPRHR